MNASKTPPVAVCPHCGKDVPLFKKGGGEAAANEMGVPFLGRIPIEPAIVGCSDDGVPFMTRTGSCQNAFASFSEIVARVREFCEGEETRSDEQ